MKIRIVKAGQPTYWYANKIGEVFETSDQLHCDYRVLECRDGTDSPGYVAQEDCEIVEEAEGMEKVTVLTDELGLQREYRELVRKSHEQQAQIDGLIETVANLARRVAELESGQASKEAPEPVVEKTLTRDEIIEKAKADVAELIRVGDDIDARLPQESPFYSKFYRVKFSVNRKKRTIVALIRYTRVNKETVRSRGIAKCAPGDVFNIHIGQAIALRRALGLGIPVEYVNAPQPDEPRVGDVVEVIVGCIKGERMTLTERIQKHDSGWLGIAFRHTYDCGWLGSKQLRVIDDSRDGRYGEVYSV